VAVLRPQVAYRDGGYSAGHASRGSRSQQGYTVDVSVANYYEKRQ